MRSVMVQSAGFVNLLGAVINLIIVKIKRMEGLPIGAEVV